MKSFFFLQRNKNQNHAKISYLSFIYSIKKMASKLLTKQISLSQRSHITASDFCPLSYLLKNLDWAVVSPNPYEKHCQATHTVVALLKVRSLNQTKLTYVKECKINRYSWLNSESKNFNLHVYNKNEYHKEKLTFKDLN